MNAIQRIMSFGIILAVTRIFEIVDKNFTINNGKKSFLLVFFSEVRQVGKFSKNSGTPPHHYGFELLKKNY
ncbi:hypothetical protein BpHYR1_021428 [Brachionus plicatilis]|uniref:Uncharacterized protein n=1 Tax=Brachionus plicatilis TaxID=10195 RepID=A0A3M7PTX2_BRAPC|nr:hypothetical protein BpHYR1_021428 [Brachionus plicatilis]